MAGPTGTEVELKLRVADLAALMRICVASGGLPAFTAVQKNQFLDTADRALDRGRFVLRLREEHGNGTTTTYLTAKGPSVKSQGGALSTVAEEEIELPASDVLALRATPSLALHTLENAADTTPARRALVDAMRTAIEGRALAFVGAFVTERTRLDVHFPEGFDGVLELDRVLFPGDQIHHEVEFEIPHDVDHALAADAFRALFARAGVEGRSAPGKAKRFFAALRGESLA